MAKREQYKPDVAPEQKGPEQVEQEKATTSYNPRAIVTMEDARKCPLCYPTRKGTGTAYKKHGSKLHYKCEGCGHTWTAEVFIEKIVIEHRIVELDTRQGGAA